MSSSYPGALDSLVDPTSSTTLASGHAANHAAANDAITAVQSALGVNPAQKFTSRAWRRRELPDPIVADALYAGTAPTLTCTQQTTSTITSAQALLAPNTGPFTYLGATNFQFGTTAPWTAYYAPISRYPNTYVSPNNWSQNVCAVEFCTDASVIEWRFNAVNSSAYFRVSVDGRKLAEIPVLPTAYGTYAAGNGGVMKVDLGGSVGTSRRWRIETIYMPFGGLFLPPGATAWPTPARGGRLVGFGDSITDGSGYSTALGLGTWLYHLARLTGCTDVWDQSRGGTGYITAGSYDTLPNRVASDVVAYLPDRVMLWGGYNDSGGSQSAIATAAATVISAILAQSNHPDLYVIGCFSNVAAPGTGITNTDATLKSAAATAGVPFISPVSGTAYNAAGAAVLTGAPWINAANVAAYINSTDNVHPTDAGHAYLARRIYEAYTALI